jgi:hypothetical protein
MSFGTPADCSGKRSVIWSMKSSKVTVGGVRSFMSVIPSRRSTHGEAAIRDFSTRFPIYNASGTRRIDTDEALDVSFRSAPEILDAVNTIFSPDHLQRLAAMFEFPVDF